MKKTAIALVASAAAMFAASCQKETSPIQEEFVPMTISAVAEGLNTPVKSAIEFKYDVTWTANDKIYVTDGNDKNDTFTIISESVGKTLGKFTQDGQTAFVSQETPSCDVEAYYPSSMMDGTTPTWPASQTYSPENAQTVPMYSKKTITATGDQTFSFGSLGSVLQIVFNTTQPNVTLKSIEIKDGSKTMSGEFHVDENGMAIIDATNKAGITLDLGTGVALGKAANYFNIAIPSGNYQDLTLVFTATDGKKCTMTGGKVNIAYNAVGRLTLMGEKFKADVPDGALSGKFSVSDTKKVYFSKGNLTYNVSTTTWAFYEHQYGCATGYDSNLISLFTWGYGTWSTSPDGKNYQTGDFTDWGTAIDDKSTWRTLSKDEWTYLFNNHSKKWVSVDGVNGYVIAPDGFSGELSDTYADDAALAANDLVFLPAAGRRLGSNVGDVGDYGCYWSSTANGGDYAYLVLFDSNDVYPDSDDSSAPRRYGVSVRLITEASVTPAPTPTTTGTAKATIDGSEVDVNWVQLWENGPKFAEYNVGASSATEEGLEMTFTDAIKADAEYEWGSNWCTPSKDQMNELLLAAQGNSSSKVTCNYTQENGVYGFKFTGKDTGYTSNSVFFPSKGGDSDYGAAEYWSGSAEGCAAWRMCLRYYGVWGSDWESYDQDYYFCLVRPVLVN